MMKKVIDGLLKEHYSGCGLEIVLQDEPRYVTREDDCVLLICEDTFSQV